MASGPWPAAVDAAVVVAQSRVDRPAGGDEEPDHAAADPEQVSERRWRLGSVTVTRIEDEPDRLTADGYRSMLAALADTAGFAVPVVAGIEPPWLVTIRPPGVPGDRVDRHPQPTAVGAAVGAGLAALHRLVPPAVLVGPADGSRPVSDAGWAPIVARCRRRVDAGLVDAAELPSPYDRYRPNDLLELLVGGHGQATAAADAPVLCVGEAGLDRFVVDGERLAGFDGLDAALVADRHLDLAVAQLWVGHGLGPEAVFAFYDGYGADPDLPRLDRAILAAHLLGLGPPTR